MPVISSGRSGGRGRRGGETRLRLASRRCWAREAMDCQVGFEGGGGAGEVMVVVVEGGWEGRMEGAGGGRRGTLLC